MLLIKTIHVCKDICMNYDGSWNLLFMERLYPSLKCHQLRKVSLHSDFGKANYYFTVMDIITI